MKIVYLGLNGRGGTLHYASHLASEMVEHAETHLLLPEYSDTKLISKKVNIIKIKAPPNAFKTGLLTFNYSMHKKIIDRINSINPDIINILDIHPWYVFYWNKLKSKKVVTINDPELHSGEANFLMTFLLKKITKFLLKNAYKIIVLGKKQKETLRKLGYKQKIIVSRIGNYSFFYEEGRKKLNTEPKSILFFGRIKEYKGLKYLLEALSKINKNFKLIIAGEGDISLYKKQIEKLKGKLEIHQGYISDKKVAEYFDRAAFVVMPYTDATQTGVIQIAYSFKKPVIVTKVGSLNEIVQDGKTGLVVPPKNVQKLREAINKLLSNSKRTSKMGVEAHKFMLDNLDWKKIAKKLYSDLKN